MDPIHVLLATRAPDGISELPRLVAGEHFSHRERVRALMSLWKYIDHKKYSAPQGRTRAYVQRVLNRISARSIAKRYVPPMTHPAATTIIEHDRLISKLIHLGESNPSAMARKKYFFAHRPKPNDNKQKNQARRQRQHSRVIADEKPMKSGPAAPIPVLSAMDVRRRQAEVSVKFYRAVCRDQATGRRNSFWNSDWRNGERECRRRRKQMGTGEFAA